MNRKNKKKKNEYQEEKRKMIAIKKNKKNNSKRENQAKEIRKGTLAEKWQKKRSHPVSGGLQYRPKINLELPSLCECMLSLMSLAGTCQIFVTTDNMSMRVHGQRLTFVDHPVNFPQDPQDPPRIYIT